MQDYIIMTDSCCDLTDQMARELELEVLPLTMTMDGEEYPNTLDGRYITNEEFYKRLRAGKTSTTAAANVGQFEDAMRAVLDRGQDILCLCFSSALSHHLSVRRDCCGERGSGLPGAHHPGHRHPQRLPWAGAAGVSGRSEEERGLDPQPAGGLGGGQQAPRLPLVHRGRPELPEAWRPGLRRHGAGGHHALHQAGDAYG